MASELGVQTIQHTNGTDAMTIDSSGRVFQPAKPAFSARGPASGSYITTSPIVWPQEELDRGGIYDNSTGVFTAPVDGPYKIDVQLYVRQGSGESGFPRLQKSTDGGTIWTNTSYAYVADQASAQVAITLSINIILNLNANDQIRVTWAGTADYYMGQEESWFSGFLIG